MHWIQPERTCLFSICSWFAWRTAGNNPEGKGWMEGLLEAAFICMKILLLEVKPCKGNVYRERHSLCILTWQSDVNCRGWFDLNSAELFFYIAALIFSYHLKKLHTLTLGCFFFFTFSQQWNNWLWHANRKWEYLKQSSLVHMNTLYLLLKLRYPYIN